MRVTEVAYLSVGGRKGMDLEVRDRGWDIEGVRSLEVRWIFAGRPATAVAEWFERFPSQAVTVEDAYLVDPHMPGLSVKIRDRRALEIKRYHGSPGLLEIPGRARGRLECWQKWSFPSTPLSQGSDDPAGWRTVRKRRRISRLPGCAVELTEFHVLGEDWWTLGFEATGPADALPGHLEEAAALVFSQAMPDRLELSVDDSMSFAQWLRSRY